MAMIAGGGSNIFVERPGYGVAKWNGTSWTMIPLNPTSTVLSKMVVTSAGVLFAYFSSAAGTYTHDGTQWLVVSGTTPTLMEANNICYLAYTGFGVYKVTGASTAVQITAVDVDEIAVSSDKLFGDFAGLGLFHYDGSAWSAQLSASNFIHSIANKAGVKYFGTYATGLWSWDPVNAWVNISGDVVSEPMAGSDTYITAWFPDDILYMVRLSDSATQQFSDVQPSKIVMDNASTVYGDFGSLGLWKLSWGDANATEISTQNIDDMCMVGSTLWVVFSNGVVGSYSSGTWTYYPTLKPSTETAAKGCTNIQETIPTSAINLDTWFIPSKSQLKIYNSMASEWIGLSQYYDEIRNIWAWGYNGVGSLGQNNLTNRSSPVQVGTSRDWLSIQCGLYTTFSIKTNGTLWTWGYEEKGILGQNNLVSRSSPVQIGSLTNWKELGCGARHVLAIKTDGTLWSWGYNNYGQLGDNTIINRSSPVQIGSLTTWRMTKASEFHSIAIKTDGTLWTWGYNGHGQSGMNDTVKRSSPVQVGSLTTWSMLSIGGHHTLGVTTDGKLWIWGYNFYGALGQNNTTGRSSPVQVGSLTTWKSIGSLEYSSFGITTDGTLWAWGYNLTGQLGLNDRVDRSSPVQVGSLTTWRSIELCKMKHCLAIKTDNTLWSWGYNNRGQLGDNTIINKSSPVQVGSLTTWQNASASLYHTAAIQLVI